MSSELEVENKNRAQKDSAASLTAVLVAETVADLRPGTAYRKVGVAQKMTMLVVRTMTGVRKTAVADLHLTVAHQRVEVVQKAW